MFSFQLLFVSHIKVVSFWDQFKFHPEKLIMSDIFNLWPLGTNINKKSGSVKITKILHSISNWGFWTYLGQTFILLTLVVFFIDFDFLFKSFHILVYNVEVNEMNGKALFFCYCQNNFWIGQSERVGLFDLNRFWKTHSDLPTLRSLIQGEALIKG